MPELPEVETIVRELREEARMGRVIVRVCVHWARSIAIYEPEALSDRIIGQTIQDVVRRGKFIVLQLTEDALLVHLRMTGKFLLTASKCQRFASIYHYAASTGCIFLLTLPRARV